MKGKNIDVIKKDLPYRTLTIFGSLIFLFGIITFLSIPKMTAVKETPLVSQTPVQIHTITPTPTPYFLDDIDFDSNHWKTYIGPAGHSTDSPIRFSIKYPPTWNFTPSDLGGVYYPVGKLPGPNTEFDSPRILLGTLGHGGPPQPFSPRTFPSGKALYGWQVFDNKVYGVANFTMGNKEYIFEIGMVPVKDAKDAKTFKQIFDTMLNTFQLL